MIDIELAKAAKMRAELGKVERSIAAELAAEEGAKWSRAACGLAVREVGNPKSQEWPGYYLEEKAGDRWVLGVSGVGWCRSPNACLAHCSPIKRRANEVCLRLGMTEWLEADLPAEFVTLTFQHSREDTLEGGLELIFGSLKYLTQQRQWKKWRQDYGVMGYYRASEVMWGQGNGWHPHHHLAVFHEPPAGHQPEPNFVSEFGKVKHLDQYPIGWDVCDMWVKEMKRRGNGAGWGRPYQDSRALTTGGVATYLAKVAQDEWDAATEIARGDLKRGRNGGMSVAALLVVAADLGEGSGVKPGHARALVKEHMKATKGRHTLRATPGLFRELNVDRELLQIIEKAEILDHEEPAAAMLETIGRESVWMMSKDAWDYIQGVPELKAEQLRAERGLRSELRKGGRPEDAIEEFLMACEELQRSVARGLNPPKKPEERKSDFWGKANDFLLKGKA